VETESGVPENLKGSLIGKGGKRMGAGRPAKDLLIGSIIECIRPYREIYEMQPAYHIAAAAARSIEHKYPKIMEVLQVWDSLKKRDKERHRALDKCVIEAGMDLEEFKGLILSVLKSNMLTLQEVEVDVNKLKLTRQMVKVALDPELDVGNKLLIRMGEKIGTLNPPPGIVTNVNVQTNTLVKSDSFDDFSAMLDNVLKEQKRLPAVNGEIVEENL
jgi:hypothetical protein